MWVCVCVCARAGGPAGLGRESPGYVKMVYAQNPRIIKIESQGGKKGKERT